MNGYPPFRNGGDFVAEYHHGGVGALAWTIFALQLLMLLGLGALLVSSFARTPWRRRAFPPPPGGPGPRLHDPLEVVRMRYARGDLDREQYLQAARDLGGAGEAPTEEFPSDGP